MKDVFNYWLRKYNSFSKGDRNTITILAGLILVIFIAQLIINYIQPKPNFDYAQYERFLNNIEELETIAELPDKTLFYFDPNSISTESLDTMDLPSFVKNNIVSYRKAGGKFFTVTDLKKIYGMNDSMYNRVKDFIRIERVEEEINKVEIIAKKIKGYFDPNLANEEQLSYFGFNSFRSTNLIEYRNKGGVFNQKTDLLKIYGIDTSFYNEIKNHVQISDLIKADIQNNNVRKKNMVELNRAEKADLENLEGVGPVFAQRIIKYRDLLGGFHKKTQLLEVYNFPEETYKNIEDELTVDSIQIKKIRINFVEYSDLLRNPYLDKQHVKSVLNYRNRNGAFKNLNQLETFGLIDSETFKKIRPYLTCR